MNLAGARQLLIESFVDGCYHSTVDHKKNNFIDGMAWVGVMTGVARRYGDTELVALGTEYLQQLVRLRCRSYATYQVNGDWIQSQVDPYYWVLSKKQSFAGPAGLYYAGLGPKPCTLHLRMLAQVVYLWYPNTDHMNSIMLAYLITGIKPPSSLMFVCKSNPFYGAIAGLVDRSPYPENCRYSEGRVEECSSIVPFSECEPSTWPFRRNPYIKYWCAGYPLVGYTPIWQVVGTYLQEILVS